MLLFLLPLYITRIRPDFIVIEPNEHLLSFLPTHLLYPFKRFKTVLDIRSVPVSRDTEGSRGFLKTFFFDTCVCLAKKRFDGITIITYSMKNEICKTFHIDPNRVGVWSSGASPTIFNVETHIREASKLRRELGLSGKFIVLYHGVLAPNRGLGETVEAVSTIGKENPSIVFFLLGNGAMSLGLKAMVQERMVQENVIIHDGVDYADVPKYIAMCDVGIVPLPDLPYWRHQCPLNLLEYLAMKKPVIVSDIPANREIVENGKFGIYVSSTKPAEIAKGIIYAYRNREELKKYGEAAREVVTEKYNWDKVAQSLERYLFSMTD
jgi:glycosyltransferase involved in cell wall biosynthesis